MVNRIWQHHFGRGIVATPSNFGVRGEPPTHPELLDWLAARFVASGWSIKAIHREIVLSATYQLAQRLRRRERRGRSGQPLALAISAAPARRRVDSRRDARRLGPARPRGRPALIRSPRSRPGTGPSTIAFKAVYPTNHRSVYLMTQRLVKHPFLAIFDGPDTNTSTDVRTHSTVPLQALYLMNNPFVQEQAAGFANRLIASSTTDPARRIELGVRTGLGTAAASRRSSSAHGGSCSNCRAALETARMRRASLAELEAWTSLAKVLLTANEFLYID